MGEVSFNIRRENQVGIYGQRGEMGVTDRENSICRGPGDERKWGRLKGQKAQCRWNMK